MKSHFLMSAVLLTFSTISLEAYAFNKAEFKKIAEKTVAAAISGKIDDVDGLIKDQETLIKLGEAGITEYLSKAKPEEKKGLELVIKNVANMKKSSLKQIEIDWHEGGVFQANGVKMNETEHMGAANSLADTVIHPATSYLALVEYKKSKDAKFLKQVKDELSEVLQHITHIP